MVFENQKKLAFLLMWSGCVYPIINKDQVDDYAAAFKREKQITSVLRWSIIATGVGCVAYMWCKKSSDFTKTQTKELQAMAAASIETRKKDVQESKTAQKTEPFYDRLKTSALSWGASVSEQGKALGTMIVQQVILGVVIGKINSLIGFMDFSRDALMIFLAQRTKLSSVLYDVKMCLEKQESGLLAVEVERLEIEIERVLGYMVLLKQQVAQDDVLVHKHCQFQINRLEKLTNDLTNTLYALDIAPRESAYAYIADLERFDHAVKEICYSFAAAVE